MLLWLVMCFVAAESMNRSFDLFIMLEISATPPPPFSFTSVLFIVIRTVLYDMSILVALEALNIFVFITIIIACLRIEVKILKSATANATATSSTTCLKISAVRRFPFADKKCIIRLLFLVFLRTLHILFSQ